MDVKQILRITPPNEYKHNGAWKELTPNREAFEAPHYKHGLYRFADDQDRTPFILIDSRRDTLLHITVWRIMKADGTTYETDCRNLIPLTHEEDI